MALLLQDTLLDNSSTCVSDVATTCIWVLFAVFAGVHHVLSAVIGREFSLHETCREFIRRYRQREVDSQALPMLASACPGLVVIILIMPRRMHSIDVVCCYRWSTVVCLFVATLNPAYMAELVKIQFGGRFLWAERTLY